MSAVAVVMLQEGKYLAASDSLNLFDSFDQTWLAVLGKMSLFLAVRNVLLNAFTSGHLGFA